MNVKKTHGCVSYFDMDTKAVETETEVPQAGVEMERFTRKGGNTKKK